MHELGVLAHIFCGDGSGGEFLFSVCRSAESFSGCEDLAGELGAVSIMICYLERFSLLGDEVCDFHFEYGGGFCRWLCNILLLGYLFDEHEI